MGRKIAGLAVVACVLLLGCTGQEESPPTSTADPPSTEPSAEATTAEPTTIEPPDLDPPVFPEEAREDTPAGAVAMAGYFLEVYNYTNNTNDTKYFTAIAGPDCNYCAGTISFAKANAEAGFVVVGGELSADLAEANVLLPTEGEPYYTVQINVDETPIVVLEPDGTEREKVPGVPVRMGIGIQYVDSIPTILGVNYEKI